MDYDQTYFITYNKLLSEKLDYCIHTIEKRLDKLFEQNCDLNSISSHSAKQPWGKTTSPYSPSTYLHFKAPYIRDFRGFSGPSNNDVKQIKELAGVENMDSLIKSKTWSKESTKQLFDAVLDHYAQVHIIELIKQKNLLVDQSKTGDEPKTDLEQKLSLIDGQIEQVKARKQQQIFVPSNRNDPNIDWCAISARLTSNHDAQDCRLMWTNKLHWSVSDNHWTKEEDDCLLNAIQRFGKNDWDSVAKELNSSRLPWQCCSRYQQEFANSCNAAAPMSEDDVDKIIEVVNLCRIGNFVPWNQVMYFVQYHNLLQVKYQWNKLLAARNSNQPWTHGEDLLLLKAVERFGTREWNRISNLIPGRSNKSCRERYTMRLRFQKRAIGSWMRKEDENLLSLVERFGTNWALIASYFEERNHHQLRNRFELLKNDPSRTGPRRHRKVYRDADGMFFSLQGRRQRPSSEREVDQRLQEIFSTYQLVKHSTKSIVCRGAQDELINQSLVQSLCDLFRGSESKQTLLNCVISKALRHRVTTKYDLFPPCYATIRGYKAWALQQDYLSQFNSESIDIDNITSSPEYSQILKIIVSLFLWPAVLTKLTPPKLEDIHFPAVTLIEKGSKNLYKVRGIQQQLTKPK